MLALRNGRTPVAKVLLDAGAALNSVEKVIIIIIIFKVRDQHNKNSNTIFLWGCRMDGQPYFSLLRRKTLKWFMP